MQEHAWENEYKSRRMLSPSNVVQADVGRFAKWFKKGERQKDREFDYDRITVLDLGSGTGRNAFYFADRGAKAIGYEVSDTALSLARSFSEKAGLTIEYRKQDIGSTYPLPDASVDIVLDVTSSNSLTDAARATYLSEMHRVLKPGGVLFVRALSKEADKHAKELIVRFPGPEKDTYIHPDLRLTEKVFTKESFEETYAPYFSIEKLERIEHYATVAGRKYKRQYWISYLRKK